MTKLKKAGGAAIMALLLLSLLATTVARVKAEDDESTTTTTIPDEDGQHQISENDHETGDHGVIHVENNHDQETGDHGEIEVENNQDHETGDHGEVQIAHMDDNEVDTESVDHNEDHPEEIDNMYRLGISTESGAEFKLEYSTMVENVNNQMVLQEIQLEFQVKFSEIVEFQDANGNGLYDQGEEIFVYNLEDAAFAPIQTTTENVAGTTVHVITFQTTDGVFKAIVYQSGEPLIVDGENVRPNEAKITIEINNFPYHSQDSKLALKTEFESQMEISTSLQNEEGEHEGEVQMTHDGYAGFFSWKQTALVDNVERPVKSSSLTDNSGEAHQQLYMVYEHGTSIVHDPTIGVSGTIAGFGTISWETVVMSAIAAAIVSITVTAVMLRRKKH